MSNNAPLLSREEIEAINKPIDQARTLPPRAFFSQDFYQAEQEKIFASGWYALEFEALIPSPGDARAASVADIPVLLTRDREGRVRAFHNICPYDGGPILSSSVSGAETLNALYHGWEYDLEGKFRRAPYWGNGGKTVERGAFEPGEVDLVEISVGLWGGLIFVNPNNDAGSFEDYIEPFASLCDDIDFDALEPEFDGNRPRVDHVAFSANWKTVFENGAANVLHEGFVHDVYKQSDEIPRVDDEGNKAYSELAHQGLYGLVFSAADVEDTYPDLGFPRLLTPQGEKRDRLIIGQFYPNVGIGAMAEHIFLIILNPHGPERCDYQELRFYTSGTANLAEGRDILRNVLLEAHAEDAEVVGAVQKLRRSPAATSNFYSPFWDTPHYEFTKQLVRDLQKAD